MTLPAAATVTEAQQAVDNATMWVAEALATAQRRREQTRQAYSELEAASEALLLAELLLQHARAQVPAP